MENVELPETPPDESHGQADKRDPSDDQDDCSCLQNGVGNKASFPEPRECDRDQKVSEDTGAHNRAEPGGAGRWDDGGLPTRAGARVGARWSTAGGHGVGRGGVSSSQGHDDELMHHHLA